ncbi:MAG: group 1 truncated hemoglobin [Planctomycetaceae bacterium]|nr:group 1 truncated hemoglobin [Planctomycetaceae bacterium]
MATQEGNLFDRIGGELGLERLLADFYDRVLADAELAHFFARSSMDKVRRMQREFFGAALDGPQVYSGLSLSWVHSGRGITTHHFNLFGQHLLATLSESGIDEVDVREVVHRISVHKNDITGEGY